MNRRERVLAAIRHETTDFVPYQFHGEGALFQKLAQHYDLPNTEAVVAFIGNHLVKVGSDFNVNPWAAGIEMGLVPTGGAMTTALDTEEGGLHPDEFGCVWNRMHGRPHPVAYPLQDDYQLLDTYVMPDPYRAGRFDQARALADRYRGQVFIFGKLGMTLFERAWSIRGMQELFVDMAERPELVEELMDRIVTEWNLPIIDQQLALGLDGFYFADDWGSKTNMMFSKAMWRRFIKPRLARCYDRVKAAGVYVGQHTDGNVQAVIPDLIELGLDILNPIQASVYDPNVIKAQYGDRLTLYGGVDVETTMSFGSPAEVRAEVFDRAHKLGQGGGYILQTTHTCLSDYPLENITAYIEACHALAQIDTGAALARARAASSPTTAEPSLKPGDLP